MNSCERDTDAAIEEELTWDDLPKLGSSPDDVVAAFEKTFGKRPDGIALNHATYYDAVEPAITEQFGHSCHKHLKDITYRPAVDTGERKVTIAHSVLINNGSEKASLTAQLGGSWSDSTSVEISSSNSLSFSSSVSVEGLFDMGLSFSSSASRSNTQTNTHTQSYLDSVTTEVPPNSSVRIEAVATVREQKVAFEADAYVDGYFGGNFPDRVDGHYFWFLSASRILPSTTTKWRGEVKGVKVVEIKTQILPRTDHSLSVHPVISSFVRFQSVAML